MSFVDSVKTHLLESGFQDVYVYNEVVSTNNIAKEIAGVSNDWTIVAASRQSGGRGRTGKSFFSPDGGVYLSVILKKRNIPYAPYTAVALSNTIEEIGEENQIKWVNDIYIGDKKVAGILCESVSDKVIIGVGVNIVEPNGGFPKDINACALNVNILREKFIATFLKNLKWTFENISKDEALKVYRERDYLKWKNIEVSGVNETFLGQALGIDEDFGLIVLKDGEEIHLSSGVISIKTI